MHLSEQDIYTLAANDYIMPDTEAPNRAVLAWDGEPFIVMVPTLIVYVIFQNQIQRGLTVGALKG